MAYASVNGQRLHYQDTGGDGPAVVFSHGFLMDHEMFAPQVEALKDTHRVVTWDERGFGSTEFDGSSFSYWDSADDVLGLMDHLGIERAVLGGMSQGGFLSMRAALRAPERVRGLILIDTEARAMDDETREANGGMVEMWLSVGPVDDLAQAVASIIIDHPDHDPVWIAKWQARDKDLIVEAWNCLESRDDLSDRLGEITCPAVVIHGTEDSAIPMERAEELAGALQGAGPVVKVSGAHAPNLTNPAPVNDAIASFLTSLPD